MLPPWWHPYLQSVRTHAPYRAARLTKTGALTETSTNAPVHSDRIRSREDETKSKEDHGRSGGRDGSPSCGTTARRRASADAIDGASSRAAAAHHATGVVGWEGAGPGEDPSLAWGSELARWGREKPRKGVISAGLGRGVGESETEYVSSSSLAHTLLRGFSSELWYETEREKGEGSTGGGPR